MTTDTPKKKRKNPWHKRRVNQRYRELCEKIEHNPRFINKYEVTNKLVEDLKYNTDSMIKIRADYERIMTRQVKGDPFQGLPIETLEDLCQMEKDGYVSKPSFQDLIRANQLKKQGQELIEHKSCIVTDVKVSQIDLILAEIDIILKASE